MWSSYYHHLGCVKWKVKLIASFKLLQIASIGSDTVVPKESVGQLACLTDFCKSTLNFFNDSFDLNSEFQIDSCSKTVSYMVSDSLAFKKNFQWKALHVGSLNWCLGRKNHVDFTLLGLSMFGIWSSNTLNRPHQLVAEIWPLWLTICERIREIVCWKSCLINFLTDYLIDYLIDFLIEFLIDRRVSDDSCCPQCELHNRRLRPPVGRRHFESFWKLQKRFSPVKQRLSTFFAFFR